MMNLPMMLLLNLQDIDKSNTEINRHKVQIETNEKMIKKLTKGVEESKKEKERLAEEKEKLRSKFKDIEQKAFMVQENYEKTQKVDFSTTYSFRKHFFNLCTYTIKYPPCNDMCHLSLLCS